MHARAVQQKWTLASVALTDAYTDFTLSRQAMNCTPATLEFYKYTAGAFLSWIENQGVTGPQEVTARHVRQYLAQLIDGGKKVLSKMLAWMRLCQEYKVDPQDMLQHYPHYDVMQFMLIIVDGAAGAMGEKGQPTEEEITKELDDMRAAIDHHVKQWE